MECTSDQTCGDLQSQINGVDPHATTSLLIPSRASTIDVSFVAVMDLLGAAHLCRTLLHLCNIIFLTVHAAQSTLICVMEDAIHTAEQSTSWLILRQAVADLNLTSADVMLSGGTAHDITWRFADGRPDNCSVVIVAATCQRAEMLKTAFDNSSLPLFVYSDDICDQAFTLSPWSPTSWTRAVVDVLVALGWTDVILVYDDSSMEPLRRALVRELSRHHVGLVPIAISGDEVTASVASSVMASRISLILVCIGSSSATLDLPHELHNKKYFWIVACPALESSDQQFLFQNASNMAVLYIAPRDSSSLQTTCSHGNFTAMALSRVKSALSETFPELIVSSYGSSRLLESTEDKRSYSERLQRFNERAEEYVLCAHQPSGPLSFQSVGVWSSTTGLTMSSDFTFPMEFKGFYNKTLRVGVWEAVPFLKRLSNQSDSIVYEGLCIDILQELSHQLNFTYQLIEPADGHFGAPTANGSWNGMIAMLMHDELDLAIGPLTITSVREAVIDFTVPYMEDGGGILTKGGDPAPDFLNIFRPFPLGVWLILCACIMTTGTMLFAISKADTAGGVSDGHHTTWSLDDCLLLTFSSLMSQGFERYPRCTAGRLVLGCWWVFSILIVSMYTATLAAMLTVTVGEDTIDSIDDLAESSLTPITLTGTNWQTMFLTAESGVFEKVGRRMAHSPVFRNDADAVKYVMEGSAAYILDLNIIRYLYSQDCKHLHMAKNTFVSNGLGFAVPENAIYREQINAVLLKLQESGLMDLWRNRWWRTFLDCGTHGASVRSSQQLDFVSIGGVLILYVSFITLAIVCLFIQLFYKQRKSCRSQKMHESSTNVSDALHQSQRSHENKTSEPSSEKTTRQSSLSSDA